MMAETASDGYLYLYILHHTLFWSFQQITGYPFIAPERIVLFQGVCTFMYIERGLMFPNFPFLPYLQAQTVGLPVTVHSPSVRAMRSALLPQASTVDAFAFPTSGCQAEAAFMEEECVDTPKVCTCLRDSELAGWLEPAAGSADVVLWLS